MCRASKSSKQYLSTKHRIKKRNLHMASYSPVSILNFVVKLSRQNLCSIITAGSNQNVLLPNIYVRTCMRMSISGHICKSCQGHEACACHTCTCISQSSQSCFSHFFYLIPDTYIFIICITAQVFCPGISLFVQSKSPL